MKNHFLLLRQRCHADRRCGGGGEGMVSQAEEPSETHETSSTISDASIWETKGLTGKGPACGPRAAVSSKRKLSHAGVVSSELRPSERLAKRRRI
jgi:hypothetical protein